MKTRDLPLETIIIDGYDVEHWWAHMTLPREFVASVESACTMELVKVGFRKRRAGLLTYNLGGDIQGWVGLNMETHRSDSSVFVNPTIGLRHDELQELISKIGGHKPHKYIPPTVAGNLGYFMPAKTMASYEFLVGSIPTDTARRLAADVDKHGLNVMRANASLEAVKELIPKMSTWEDAGERLIVTEYLRSHDIAAATKIGQEYIAAGKTDRRFWQRVESFMQLLVEYAE